MVVGFFLVQTGAIEKIRNIFAIPELRRKILFTLGILVIVRLGSQVPIPGINPVSLQQFFEQQSSGILGIFDTFSPKSLL